MRTKRIIITAIVGTLILFAWNALSWMVLPFHSNALKNIPEKAMNAEMLKQNLESDGVYHYPGLPENNTPEGWAPIQEKLKTGPRITLMVYKSGETSVFSPSSFLTGLLFNLLTVLLLLFIIKKIENKSSRNIIMLSLAFGLLISFARDFPQMVWYLYPLHFTLIEVFDTLISFLLLGLFLGLYSFKPNAQKHEKAS